MVNPRLNAVVTPSPVNDPVTNVPVDATAAVDADAVNAPVNDNTSVNSIAPDAIAASSDDNSDGIEF
jgi:hypothetical protein